MTALETPAACLMFQRVEDEGKNVDRRAGEILSHVFTTERTFKRTGTAFDSLHEPPSEFSKLPKCEEYLSLTDPFRGEAQTRRLSSGFGDLSSGVQRSNETSDLIHPFEVLKIT